MSPETGGAAHDNSGASSGDIGRTSSGASVCPRKMLATAQIASALETPSAALRRPPSSASLDSLGSECMYASCASGSVYPDQYQCPRSGQRRIAAGRLHPSWMKIGEADSSALLQLKQSNAGLSVMRTSLSFM